MKKILILTLLLVCSSAFASVEPNKVQNLNSVHIPEYGKNVDFNELEIKSLPIEDDNPEAIEENKRHQEFLDETYYQRKYIDEFLYMREPYYDFYRIYW